MIKRIIFDVDNTLLPWRDEYMNSYAYALDDLGVKYTLDDIKDIDRVIDEYENYYNIYDRKQLNDFINSKININLPEEFVNLAIKYLAKCYKEEDKEVEKILEYLYKKYELVVLTNWFRENQESRLNSLGLSKYFTDMYFTDEVLNKPNKEAFIKACGNHDVSECIMVGDNYEKDIKGALDCGIDSILIDSKNKYNYKKKVNSIYELKNIL